jgi:hypothetical protein
VSDPAGRARPWAGRSYAHLVLPTPSLTPAQLAAFNAAVTSADDWRPDRPGQPERPGGATAAPGGRGPAGGAVVPPLGAAWRRGDGRRVSTLRLAVLGWYPLLVTAGVDRADLAGRKALSRLVTVAVRAGARPVPDAELADRVAAAPGRWDRAAALLAEAAGHAAALTARDCPACPARSLHLATHCQGCGRRFTTLDDQHRDEHAGTARTALAAARNTLLTLATDLTPPPPPPPPPTPDPQPDAEPEGNGDEQGEGNEARDG